MKTAPTFSLPFGIPWLAVGFAVRTTAASLTALYIALALDLGEAKWAAMTVWIVAQPSRGMSLSKSKYRLAGTLVGAYVAVVLVAAFAQMPEMFFLALATWLALCTAVSTALRNFRSYGAVLAGYTAAIIGIAGANQPGVLFEVAVARVSYISLGIVAEAAFAAVFATGDPVLAIRQRLHSFVRSAAGVTASALRGEYDNKALQQLISSAIEVDNTGEFAAASSSEARRYLGHLRTALTATLSQIAAAQTIQRCLSELDEHDRLLTSKVADGFASVATSSLDSALELEDLPRILGRSEGDTGVVAFEGGTEKIFDEGHNARLGLLLFRAEEVIRISKMVGDKTAPAIRAPFAFHLERYAIGVNALRAFCAVLAAAAFWVESAWPSGGSTVATAAVVSGLFSSRPNGVVAGLGFFKGALAAIIVAGICNFALLPNVSDFPGLAAMTAPFLVAGGIAVRTPTLAAPAASYNLFVWDLIGPDNATRTDFASFANGGLALLIGILCGTVMFAVLFPYRPAMIRRSLLAAAGRDLSAIGTNPDGWSQHQWLSLSADRIGRHAAASVSISPQVREHEFGAMLASLTIGHAAIALSGLSRSEDAIIARPLDCVLRRLGTGKLEHLAVAANRAATRLYHVSHNETLPPVRRRELAHAANRCADIAHAVANLGDVRAIDGE